MFAKGIVAFEGSAVNELVGSLSFTLGIGLEYVKATGKVLPFIKGNTGLDLGFSLDTSATFESTIGPFTAVVGINVTVDNYNEPLGIQFGLDGNLNYYLGTDKSLERPGFQVVSISQLVDKLDVAVAGQISATVRADFVGVPGEAWAWMDISISDINKSVSPRLQCCQFYSLSSPSFLRVFL